MKSITFAIVLLAASLLVCCDESPSSSQSNALVGTWKDNKSGIETQFNDDGTLLMTPPGAAGKWSMQSDNQLNFVLERNGRTVMSQVLKLQWNGKDDLVLTDEDGKQMRWTRSQ
jgi:hypothetical protein